MTSKKTEKISTYELYDRTIYFFHVNARAIGIGVF